jgi:hypothetical protein
MSFGFGSTHKILELKTTFLKRKAKFGLVLNSLWIAP